MMDRRTHIEGYDYFIVRDSLDLSQVASQLANSPYLCFDTETTGLDPLLGQIRLLQFKTANQQRFVIDLFETKTLGAIKDVLASDRLLIIQNAKFEQKWFLHHFGIEFRRPFDTLRASRLIYNGREKGHGLYDLYLRELNERPQDEDKSDSNWGGSISEAQWDYAAGDVERLDQLYKILRQKLIDLNLVEAAKIEFDVILPESSVELVGFGFDQERWVTLAETHAALKKEYREKLIATLPAPTDQLSFFGFGSDFNLDSDKQMLESLRRLGLKSRVVDPETGVCRKTPIISTTEQALAPFKQKYPVINDLLLYREYSKSISAFGEAFLDFVHPKTKRIHSSYFGFTGAGRYSSSKPNLQQIPRSEKFRACFRAPEGRTLVAGDFAGEELRITAEISNDAPMIKVFTDELDPHQNTAALINNIAYDRVVKSQRQQAKAFNFGLIYGMGAAKFVVYALANYGVGLTETQAKAFKKKFFSVYPGIPLWHEKALRDGQRLGYTRTLSNRIRYLDPETTYSAWFNTPVQGTGADILKVALRRVYERLKRDFGNQVYLVHHVHDEILTESVDDPEITKAASLALQEEMCRAFERFIHKVPAVVDPHVGRSWADVH